MRAFRQRNNTMVFTTAKSIDYQRGKRQSAHDGRHKRHLHQLAEHTVVHTHLSSAEVSIVRLMAHALGTVVIDGLLEMMDVMRRQQHDWQVDYQ